MTDIVTIGIDLAKNVFAVHGVHAAGKPVILRPSVPRARTHSRAAALSHLAWTRALVTSVTKSSRATTRSQGQP